MHSGSRLSKNRVIASQCAPYSALRAAFGGCAMYAACGPCGVAISWIFVHFSTKIEGFYFFWGDRRTSGAPRSESEMRMIAGGNHTIIHCGLVRDDI